MIQELFGAAAGLVPGESKISINGGGGGGGVNVLLPPSPSPSSTTIVTTTSTDTTATATTPTSATSSNSENQNLRCPRCDSANTKFCYYNNYNLTQPRHFCKTCRRYWTKGGALRNVPIGGGCRKNKSVGMSNSAAKTSTTKIKTVASELGSRPGLGHGFDPQELPPTPILWGSPQNTHLLALLRASQSKNPSPNPNHSHMSITVKEDGNLMGSPSHMVTEPLISNIGMFNPRTLGYDGGVGQVPSLFWRNNLDHHAQQQNGGFVIGEHHHNSGIQELYHKIRSSSSTTNYCSDNSPVLFHGSIASSSSPSSSSICNILEATSSVSGGDQLGYWSPTLSWADLPSTNGSAYP